jgi:sulfite reductase (NADPH) hemoprotein beta-component
MAAIDDRNTLGRARVSFADEADIDEFVTMLGRFERGEISPDEWRAFRLVRGTYGQRQAEDAQMLRVKIPQGVLTPLQLNALADVADTYSRGFGHITTRQNMQFHFVRLHEIELAMRRLADAGLTTREACGSSVRNITACPYAGVAADELFDVTPYAEAMTRYLLRHPLSSTLPRKFKIAFEGCPVDHVATGINDIGWIARLGTAEGRPTKGFQITVAGGTSTVCRAGLLLFDFLPASEILTVAEAILRVFHRLGDYQHKQRNRLKFLIKSLGWDGFRREFDRELEGIRAAGGPSLPFDPDHPPVEAPPPAGHLVPPARLSIAARVATSALRGPGILPRVEPRLTEERAGFDRWARTNVRKQSQPGWSVVTVSTVLGDLTSAQMRLLGELSIALGDGAVRVTTDQNLLFRWVPTEHVPLFYRSLRAASLGRPGAGTLADVTSCPGAESCRLAVTQSRGLGLVLSDYLERREDLVASVPGLNIKISGCPNGCGQHHIAGIGFQGSLRKVGGQPAPHYFVMVGGGTAGGITTFGRHAATVPARRCGQAIERLIDLYQEQRAETESPVAFFRRVDLSIVKEALRGLDRLSPEEATAEDFVDLGEESTFNPTVEEGECSA